MQWSNADPVRRAWLFELRRTLRELQLSTPNDNVRWEYRLIAVLRQRVRRAVGNEAATTASTSHTSGAKMYGFCEPSILHGVCHKMRLRFGSSPNLPKWFNLIWKDSKFLVAIWETKDWTRCS
jgi:hypothetical protein